MSEPAAERPPDPRPPTVTDARPAQATSSWIRRCAFCCGFLLVLGLLGGAAAAAFSYRIVKAVVKPTTRLTLRAQGLDELQTHQLAAVLEQRYRSVFVPAWVEVTGPGTVTVELPDLPPELGLIWRHQGDVRFQLVADPEAMGQTEHDAELERLRALKDQGRYDAEAEAYDAVPHLSEPVTSLLENPPLRGVSGATPNLDAVGQPTLEIRFERRTAAELESLTKEAQDRQLAIVLDGQIVSAPVIRDPISGGRAVIDGGGQWSPADVTVLAVVLNTRPLPAPLELVSEERIGPE